MENPCLNCTIYQTHRRNDLATCLMCQKYQDFIKGRPPIKEKNSMERTCVKCGEPKDFIKDFKAIRGGRATTCNDCKVEEIKAANRRIQNRKEEKRPTQVCRECGDEKVLDDFQRLGRGHTSVCKKCRADNQARIRKEQDAKEPGLQPDPAPANGKKTITLDFSKFPEIYDALVDLARDELRTPENQLIWALKNATALGEKLLAAEV